MGDATGDFEGDALGAGAGWGCPRPPSPVSPRPPVGSRFWALSQSETESDVDELASVEDLSLLSVAAGGGGAGDPCPFIDRALSSPRWTRARRGCHGSRRSAGGRPSGPSTGPPPSTVVPIPLVPDPDPAGTLDLRNFPPLQVPIPSGVGDAGPGSPPSFQVGEVVIPMVATAIPAMQRPPAPSEPSGWCSPLSGGP
jgi:hypothetical protein